MKKQIKIIYIYIILSIFLIGCSEDNVQEKCLYAQMEKSSLGTDCFGIEVQNKIVDVINENSVRVKNQSAIIEDYKIILDEYFCEKDIPVVVYKFLITNSEGEKLTKEKAERVLEMHQNRIDIYNEEHSGTMIEDEMLFDEEGNVVWYVAELQASIGVGDTVLQVKENEQLTQINLLWEDDEYIFYLPDYAYHDKSITFDTSENNTILSLKVTDAGISVIWNIQRVLAEYEQFIKNLPPNEDPENYGYQVYENISIIMKDGTEYRLNQGKESIVLSENMEVREDEALASYTALWEEKIEVRDVSKVIIDGQSYNIAISNVQ